jgi:hypothetical protein
MIKSPVFYRGFVLLEFRRAKRTNLLKDVGMVSVNPKRHKPPGGVTLAAVGHVLESNALGATAPESFHVRIARRDFEEPL